MKYIPGVSGPTKGVHETKLTGNDIHLWVSQRNSSKIEKYDRGES
jgi:hypothetical protein